MAKIDSNHAEKQAVMMMAFVIAVAALGYAYITFNIEDKLFPNLRDYSPAAAIMSQVEKIFEAAEPAEEEPLGLSRDQARTGTSRTNDRQSGTNNYIGDYTEPHTTETATTSRYYGTIQVSRGNAGQERYNSNKEYVILRASRNNKEPIAISGWTLKNGKDEKFYDVVGGTIRGVSNYVKIPWGTHLLYGDRPSMLTPIILNPGDTAIVVSGRIGNTSPVNVDASFRVNKCSGYIDKLSYYDFYPSLATNSCPDYRQIDATDMLSETCYNFVKSIGQCSTPDTQRDDEYHLTINRRTVPFACESFVAKHYNYNACISEFSNDSDFYKNEWRIFLNTGILWARQNETITLLDSAGKVVDTFSY